MMPKDDTALPLSHVTMMGIGLKMMVHILKGKNVPNRYFMVHLAKIVGVKSFASQESM